MILLEMISKSDVGLKEKMKIHYSKPKGFVGRHIIYRVSYGGNVYGYISGGSATLHLPGRKLDGISLNSVVNNNFFHIEPINGEYPVRNFFRAVLREYRRRIQIDWRIKYGEVVIMHESLVELPRQGEQYKRDGWVAVGLTAGNTCKRVAGDSSDSWSGKRVWSKGIPKIVFIRNVEGTDHGSNTM